MAQEFTRDDLKAWRARMGWTQRIAAEELGVPLDTIKSWELGRSRIAHPRLLQLACERLEILTQG